MKKEYIIRNYEDIIEGFYKDAQHIIYCQAPLKTKVKMLHGAHYRATYYLSLQNHLLKQELDQKSELQE